MVEWIGTKSIFIKKALTVIEQEGKPICAFPEGAFSYTHVFPRSLLGKAIKIYLKDGRAFHFQPMAAGEDWVGGHDDEANYREIKVNDIDFIIGG